VRPFSQFQPFLLIGHGKIGLHFSEAILMVGSELRAKPPNLAQRGHEIFPALPDDDFDAAVRIAQAEFDQGKPDEVVGSSRCGAMAMNMDSASMPLVLLCAAWKRCGTATKVKPNTVILHSPADETVRFQDSQELLRNSGMPESALAVVGMADSESLAKMLEAVEAATPKIPTDRPLHRLEVLGAVLGGRSQVSAFAVLVPGVDQQEPLGRGLVGVLVQPADAQSHELLDELGLLAFGR
jgi:hypothetical protein